MLGGSSGINYMAYGRPRAEDIDDWSKTLGIPGWSWSDLLPYFTRSEKLEIGQPNIKNRDFDDCPVKQDLHGTDGAIHTSMNPWQVPFDRTLLPALDEVSGLSRPEDPTNGNQLGFYRSLFTIDRLGRPSRSYAASGYLAPIIGRQNLRVLTSTLACKVLLENRHDGSLLARGVELQHEGASYSAFAKREVILSAGSVRSPQLLELSGIGDTKVLEKAQIPCVIYNSDVGCNLQDHTMTAVVYELAPGAMSLDSIFEDPALAKEHQKLYTESYSGAMSGSISINGVIPYSSQVSKIELERTIASVSSSPVYDQSPPQNAVFQRRQQEAIITRMRDTRSAHIQAIGVPANFDIARGHANSDKLMSGAPIGHNACYSIIVSNMYPLSRGSVHIRSSSPLDAPLIDPGFLSHQADVDVLAAGVAFAERVFQSGLVKDKVARRVDPPPEIDLGHMEVVREFVREHVVTYHHALGTCAMGHVVDECLRVKGVHGLRVVDASVLPMQISAPTKATVYAVAEKAADMIKDDHPSFK
uniref:Putative GMC oxidoreductase n=1 Tax=Cladonia uncialis subsp. uncialis TaxID=180999 RepID=A0A1Z1C4U4_CLAUC|nr:putative GMC oxidoreductase [Cladonia uncialis subsp. uncialis]AUW31364.1 putative GMC oxidoreductase [Cladonia uncialis subsp. uncialis]